MFEEKKKMKKENKILDARQPFMNRVGLAPPIDKGKVIIINGGASTTLQAIINVNPVIPSKVQVARSENIKA